MAEVSKKTSAVIYHYVTKDLNPGVFDVVWRVATALFVGGLLSMFVCGQFGIGFSAIAKGWNHAMHAHMGAAQCAILCGSIFSVVPVLFLRLLSSGVLFRKIIRHYSLAQVCMIFIAGSGMYMGGLFMNELINIALWSISAFFSFKLVGMIVDEAPRHLMNKGTF
ncbi:MAG: hypothetical protein H6618_05840 [Deltaproteobacteria bacterium]|nr:hypothetical protein [Deltaproteobacteria bacterium]